MSEQLEQLTSKMQSTRDKMLAFVAMLDDAKANQKLDNQKLDNQKQGEEGWSVRETLAHLIDAERAHRRFMQGVIDDNVTTIENFDINRWNAGRIAKRANQSVAEIVAELKSERAQTLDLLPTIPDDAWQKVGPHAALGEVSVEYVAKIIGLHERMHLQEMVEKLGNSQA